MRLAGLGTLLLWSVGAAFFAWLIDFFHRKQIGYREPTVADIRRIHGGFALFSLKYRRSLRLIGVTSVWLGLMGAALIGGFESSFPVALLVTSILVGSFAFTASTWWYIQSSFSKRAK